MNYSSDRFQVDIINYIELCKIEIEKRNAGSGGESTVEQLKKIILPELELLLQKVNADNLPPKADRYLISFANAFTVWGWNMQKPTQLYIKLTELNNNYRNLEETSVI